MNGKKGRINQKQINRKTSAEVSKKRRAFLGGGSCFRGSLGRRKKTSKMLP